MKIMNLEFAPISIPFERRMQTLGVLFFVFMFMQGISLIGVSFLIFLLFTPFCWISLAYFVWFYFDLDRCDKGGRGSQWARNWQIWKHYCNYFPIELIKTTDLNPEKNYLFCVSPHGVMCFGIFGNFATEATGFSSKFPGITPHLLTLNAQFTSPFMREIFMMSGACAASAKSIKYILNNQGRCKQKGQAPCLIVGGAAESLEAYPGRYRLVLRKRKGFIRLALETGTDLVPVFSFGENDLFSSILVSENSMFRKLQNKLKKWLSFGLPIFWGRGIFNYNFGILPYRKPIHTVVGSPIPVSKVEHPSQQQIDELHELYIRELIKLFNEHKAKYLVDKHTALEIL